MGESGWGTLSLRELAQRLWQEGRRKGILGRTALNWSMLSHNLTILPLHHNYPHVLCRSHFRHPHLCILLQYLPWGPAQLLQANSSNSTFFCRGGSSLKYFSLVDTFVLSSITRSSGLTITRLARRPCNFYLGQRSMDSKRSNWLGLLSTMALTTWVMSVMPTGEKYPGSALLVMSFFLNS